MYGPSLLVAAMTRPSVPDKFGNTWQYHSRSDRHSKVTCWGVAFDLLRNSAVLRSHVGDGKVVLGVNQTMSDFSTGRRKDLDLVIARSSEPPGPGAPTFRSLAERWQIPLDDTQLGVLSELPDFRVGLANAGAVLVALEAKAAMTAHIKSLPRLYDELNSSHQCVHGASRQALAMGFVLINAADEFLSPGLNNRDLASSPATVSKHAQPLWLTRTVGKVREIHRRSSSSDQGFDGLAIVVVDARNDGSPIKLVTSPPAPQRGDPDHYDSMVLRLANEYDATFTRI